MMAAIKSTIGPLVKVNSGKDDAVTIYAAEAIFILAMVASVATDV